MARTKAQKRARPKISIRQQYGRWQEPAPRRDYEEDHTCVVIEARARQMRQAPMEAFSAPIYGDDVGRCIMRLARSEAEANALYATFCDLDAVDATYHRRIIGRPRFAAVSRMEYLPEAFETRADTQADLRDDATKDRDATSAWMHWQGMLGHLTRDEHRLIWDAIRHRTDVMRDGRPTTTAPLFVAALRVLTGIVGGRD